MKRTIMITALCICWVAGAQAQVDTVNNHRLSVDIQSIFREFNSTSVQYQRVRPGLDYRTALGFSTNSTDDNVDTTSSSRIALNVRVGIGQEKQHGNLSYGYGTDVLYSWSIAKRDNPFGSALGDFTNSNRSSYGILPYLMLGYNVHRRISISIESFSTIRLNIINYDFDIEEGTRKSWSSSLFDGFRLYMRLQL